MTLNTIFLSCMKNITTWQYSCVSISKPLWQFFLKEILQTNLVHTKIIVSFLARQSP